MCIDYGENTIVVGITGHGLKISVSRGTILDNVSIAIDQTNNTAVSTI